MKLSTRLHGIIDRRVSATLGSLAVASPLPRPVRRILGLAALSATSYGLVTDYEAGRVRLLSMRRHLALDAATGAVLCAAGLLLRRQPVSSRALLLGIGLAELALVALSDTVTPAPTPAPSPGYQPLDTPKQVADGIWIVDSLLPGPLGMQLPLRMTVVRLPDGSLLLHSPTRFGVALHEALTQLGPIGALVAPNVAHWIFLQDWQRACPEAATWAAPGLRERRQVRKSGVRLDHDLGDTAPDAWGGAIEVRTIAGGFGFREVALFHRPTRTLLLTDLVLNLDADRLPAALRPVARLLGVTAPDGMPPPYMRAVFRLHRRAVADAARALLALQPERVVFAHGQWFERDGTAALRRSLRWLV